ncbi:MAG: Na/Pi symporter, partial [bacterium]|nr:Na/Pi symporter [bacterium]
MLVLKILALFAILYVFIVSINMMGGAFKLFGKEFAKTVFQTTSNPLVGLMIGVLATAVIQSSSTSTSIIVGLVAAGVTAEGGLSFEAAIPMVMGANIGTSVTNTIVSLGHITQGDEFKRAYGGSMLHDFFNICAVAVLLPIETMFHPIQICARYAQELFSGFGGVKFASPLAL